MYILYIHIYIYLYDPETDLAKRASAQQSSTANTKQNSTDFHDNWYSLLHQTEK